MSVTIANYDVRRILVDNESFTNMLFCDTFIKMNLSLEHLRKVSTPLVNFTGNLVDVEGDITLCVTIGIEPRQITICLNLIHGGPGPVSIQCNT